MESLLYCHLYCQLDPCSVFWLRKHYGIEIALKLFTTTLSSTKVLVVIVKSAVWIFCYWNYGDYSVQASIIYLLYLASQVLCTGQSSTGQHCMLSLRIVVPVQISRNLWSIFCNLFNDKNSYFLLWPYYEQKTSPDFSKVSHFSQNPTRERLVILKSQSQQNILHD